MSNAAVLREVPPEILEESHRSDAVYVRLAREMAMNHYEVEELMVRHGLTPEQFRNITSSKRFARLLQSEMEAWNAAGNTMSRVRFKALSVIEEFMPDAYELLLSKDETLNSKARLLDSLVEIAGAKAQEDQGGASVESLSININIGNDVGDLPPGRLIDGQIVLNAKREAEDVVDDDGEDVRSNWNEIDDNEFESEETIGLEDQSLSNFTADLLKAIDDDLPAGEPPPRPPPKQQPINTVDMVDKLRNAFDRTRTHAGGISRVPAAQVGLIPASEPVDRSNPWGDDDAS